MTTPSTLVRDISPPPTRRSSRSRIEKQTHAIEPKTIPKNPDTTDGEPSLAAVEAGQAQVKDHLAYFSHHLYEASRQTPSNFPRIARDGFQNLYVRNQHARGRHFVIHQHDHPISGSLDESPSLHISTPKLMMQGKACTTTCDCSSPKRAPSASPYPTACQATRTLSGRTVWQLRPAYTICGTTL